MKAMVTGGTGFLAGHLIDKLQGAGHAVRTLDLANAPTAELAKRGVEVKAGDLRDAEAVAVACAGMDTVFHVAALAAPFGPRKLFWGINVTGTDNVISGCKAAGVKRLVHVSSPSAVFDGTDHVNADESLPYPKKFMSHYCETKAISEQHALAANGPDLETVALRPHAIWGPRDKNLWPRIISRARAGKMVQVGDGLNEITGLYVENGADALILAAKAPAEKAAGKVYFINDGVPVKLWEFVRRVLSALNIPGPKRQISYRTAYVMGAIQEFLWSALHLKGEPTITRYTASELARHHTYSIARARSDLGYNPRIGLEEGLEKTIAWFKTRA
ncbi:MAG TPA: NAD-dependent epimerase/dehydratase family protein [bacterium]|nr:NAD-dependent epimerase/dehydratase family protein [bacterium]